jgi:phosphate transport system protein
MKEHFAVRLEALRRRLILMSGEVEKQIRLAIEAHTEGSLEKARRVIANDEEIDRLENQIEEETIQLLALEQPVAIDLRFLVAVLKINNDLERIGDHAVNIAEGAERLAGKPPFAPAVEIPAMSEMVQAMLRESLDAFIARDAALAKQVIRKDDLLDAKNEGVIRQLLTYMAETPSLISHCLELISVSKNLERVGDLATNIAEDTIFIAEAKLVKHHGFELAAE